MADTNFTQIPQAPQPQQQNRRFIPVSDVEFMSLTTITTWGKSDNVSSELRERLRQSKYFRDAETGKIFIESSSLWDMLSFYTQDMRLANLDSGNGELNYCAYYLDLAGDFLNNGSIKAFQTALRKVITRLELSQSKGGFLRKRMGTVTSENRHEINEQKKTNLMGVRRNE